MFSATIFPIIKPPLFPVETNNKSTPSFVNSHHFKRMVEERRQQAFQLIGFLKPKDWNSRGSMLSCFGIDRIAFVLHTLNPS